MKRNSWAIWNTFIIGRQDNPMMKRVRVIQTPWFGVYLHFIYREALDLHEHDHPWNFVRMVLRGGYTELYTGQIYGGNAVLRPFRPGYFPTESTHRITEVKPGTTSLVLVGRNKRVWGFWVPDRIGGVPCRTWVDWHDYLGVDR